MNSDQDDKLAYIKNRNSLLQSLDLKSLDRIIYVKENSLADANFIITNIMQQNFAIEDNVGLVILHNTIGHYHNVGRKLNYNFLRKIEEGCAFVLEPLKTIVGNLGGDDNEKDNQKTFNYLTAESEQIVKQLFLEIRTKVADSLSKNKGNVHLIIDDLSHLFDLNVRAKDILTFLKCCIALTEDDRLYLVLGCHVGKDVNPEEALVSTFLEYAADLLIQVSPLQTGRSNDVTGFLALKRLRKDTRKETVLHYKSTDKEIRVFNPGEALIYYK